MSWNYCKVFRIPILSKLFKPSAVKLWLVVTNHYVRNAISSKTVFQLFYHFFGFYAFQVINFPKEIKSTMIKNMSFPTENKSVLILDHSPLSTLRDFRAFFWFAILFNITVCYPWLLDSYLAKTHFIWLCGDTLLYQDVMSGSSLWWCYANDRKSLLFLHETWAHLVLWVHLHVEIMGALEMEGIFYFLAILLWWLFWEVVRLILTGGLSHLTYRIYTCCGSI